MKSLNISSLFVIAIFILSGCGGNSSENKNKQTLSDTISVHDTGYTGIKKYTSGPNLIKEITFKNGVREGLMRSFYAGGRVRQTFIYRNGLRADSSIWFYEEGQVFRTTLYKNDTMEGLQKQYYRTGKLKAKLMYKKGMRTPFLEEYTPDGKIVKGYPEVVVSIHDNYKTNSTFSVTLSLSDKSAKVKFFRGYLTDGAFDTTRVARIKMFEGTGSLNLKKTSSAGPGYVGVIAEIITGFGNKNLVYKKITLPYKDLN